MKIEKIYEEEFNPTNSMLKIMVMRDNYGV